MVKSNLINVFALVGGLGITLIVGRLLLKPAAPPAPEPIEPEFFPVRILADPTIVDNDSATFEVTYVNSTNEIQRFDAKFLIKDPENSTRVDREQLVEIPPNGQVVVFWDSGDLLTLRNLPGNWTALFQAFDRFQRDFTAQEQEIVFPVTL